MAAASAADGNGSLEPPILRRRLRRERLLPLLRGDAAPVHVRRERVRDERPRGRERVPFLPALRELALARYLRLEQRLRAYTSERRGGVKRRQKRS